MAQPQERAVQCMPTATENISGQITMAQLPGPAGDTAEGSAILNLYKQHH